MTAISFLFLFLFPMLWSPPFAAAAEHVTADEKSVLLQFKSDVTSDPGGKLTSWSPGLSPCRDFAGVSCNAAGNVEKILIHSGNLTGNLTPSLSRLRSLQILSLFDNDFAGEIPGEFGAIATFFKLNLSRNHLSGKIPDFLGNLPGLRLLDLGGNSFSGEIPASLFKNCFKTRFVSFSHNQLSGSVPSSIANCINLVGFDFSFNNLTGELPRQICNAPAINFVSLKSNSLSGTVDDRLGGCQTLQFLDLSSNSFFGSVPFHLLAFNNLTFFNVSSNRFSGKISGFTTCGRNLEYIDVSRNNLSGEIDFGSASCRGLRFLDLGFNQLSGEIPAEIGNLKSLSVLRLGNNEIHGSVPAELGKIDLLLILDLDNLQLSGEIPISLSQCRFLHDLDLSGNRLDGEIPEGFYNMTYLEHLDLHRNQLTGTIPEAIGNLTHLEFLDLSENFLTGDIPISLGNLISLIHFNLSYNNLTGTIPTLPTIQNFGASAFSHNPFLCGAPLNTVCQGGAGNMSKRARLLSVSAIVAIVAAALILIGVCIISIVNIRAYRKKKSEEGSEILVSESTAMGSTDSGYIIGKLVLFSKSLPSKYEDWEAGTKALVDKDCLIGGGSIGTVYKATFEGGVSIAVKKLETVGRIRNQEEFEQEMSRLGSLMHPNLVAFQGYYWSSTTKLVLSEFVPNNSLYHHLHGYRYSGSSSSGARGELFWSRRFNIALGTARALAYLHHDCKPQILHLNIKSSNILLDEGFEAKLSDYGMGKLLPILGSHALAKFHTSIGYVAPELASQSLRYSDKCDVFSFGVVLLEIVSGRKPVESPGAAEVVVLRDYVRRVLEDGVASDCFDRSLRGFVEGELIQVLKLGLLCTADVPSRRPNMAEVVQFLESIRPNS